MPLRVLIADDELLARKRLNRLLEGIDDVVVVGQCVNGKEVLDSVRDTEIDVVLLDIQMPKLTGVEALALMDPDRPVVVFTTAHADYAVEAFDAGAADYLLKPIEAARLTGGVSADICEEDFSGIVEELSLNASRLRTRFELSAMPLVESIEVTVGEDLVPCGDWSYALEAGNEGVGIPTVVFTADSVPKSSTTLQIYYRYGDGEGQCSSS